MWNSYTFTKGGVQVDTFGAFSIGTVGYLFCNYFLCSLLGYSLLYPFYRAVRGLSMPVKLVSAFCIGFTCSIAVIRIVSFFCDYEAIYLPTVTALVIICFLLIWTNREDFKDDLKDLKKFNLAAAGRSMAVCVFLGISLFLLAVLSMKQADFLWVGHGPNEYSFLIDQWGQEGYERFPIVLQHYDELIFHYFVGMPLTLDFNAIFPWWVTLCVTRISIVVFIYVLFRRLEVSAPLAFVLSLFMALGTSCLVPTKYYLLFDAANPIIFIQHTGRAVGIAFALLFVAAVAVGHEKKKFLTLPFFILSGLGLTAVSLPHVMLVALVLFFAILFSVSDRASDKKANILNDGAALCYLSVAALLLMYGLPFKGSGPFALRIGLIAAVCGLFLTAVSGDIKNLFSSRKSQGNNARPFWVRMTVFLTSAAVGLFLFGNLLTDNGLSRRMAEILGGEKGRLRVETLNLSLSDPWFDASVYKRSPNPRDFRIGDFRQKNGIWNVYARGFREFATAYGWILVMILTTGMIVRKRKASQGGLSLKETVLYKSFLLSAAMLPVMLFLVDFVSIGNNSWIKSRFSEIPVYVIIFVSLYFMSSCKTKLMRALLALLLLTYSIVPFFATQRPKQIQYNWGIFKDLSQ